MTKTFKPVLPGDKSISHRLLFMAAMAEGVSCFKNLSNSNDVKTTRSVLTQLGVEIWDDSTNTYVRGVGFQGFVKPKDILHCENSGTTARHLLALLGTSNFDSIVVGDKSLSKRPMNRIAEPIHLMGGFIELSNNEFLPAKVYSTKNLNDLNYKLLIPSAQIKSALLLAAANSNIKIELSGKTNSRDHTERLIPIFGGEICIEENRIILPAQVKWKSVNWQVPYDFSAAAFWITYALLSKDSAVEFDNVLLNPRRIGFLDAIKKMGAKVEVEINHSTPEVVGRIRAEASRNLIGIEVDNVVDLIDEVPLLALLATQASGSTKILNSFELRLKERDRITATEEVLSSFGLKIEIKNDGFEIKGPQMAKGGQLIDPQGDHRMAMMALVANSLVNIKNSISDLDCSNISDPQFVRQFREVLNG